MSSTMAKRQKVLTNFYVACTQDGELVYGRACKARVFQYHHHLALQRIRNALVRFNAHQYRTLRSNDIHALHHASLPIAVLLTAGMPLREATADDLPPEILILIFKLIGACQSIAYARVNKLWYACAKEAVTSIKVFNYCLCRATNPFKSLWSFPNVTSLYFAKANLGWGLSREYIRIENERSVRLYGVDSIVLSMFPMNFANIHQVARVSVVHNYCIALPLGLALVKLHQLELISCRNLTDIAALRECVNINTLRIINCGKLETVSQDIVDMPKLTWLEIRACMQFTALPRYRRCLCDPRSPIWVLSNLPSLRIWRPRSNSRAVLAGKIHIADMLRLPRVMRAATERAVNVFINLAKENWLDGGATSAFGIKDSRLFHSTCTPSAHGIRSYT